MHFLSLGRPVFIDGEEVVVVRDLVGTPQAGGKDTEVYSQVEGKGSDGRPPIYVAESDLGRLRESYPSINVYGLWQILFHNRAVEFGGRLITYKLNETGGMYLIMESGGDLNDPSRIAHSGEYFDNYSVDFIENDLTAAINIEVDITTLRLPHQPAYTRLELTEKKKSETNRRWWVVAALCSLIVVAAGAANYYLSTIYQSRMADYSTKRTLIDELNSRVRTLSQERLIKRPDDAATLSQIYKLFELYPKTWTPQIESDQKIGFKGEHLLITPKKADLDPSKYIRGVQTELQPDLSYKVTITPIEPGEAVDAEGGAEQ
ncbi:MULTISPECIES: hypothetical protein [Pseudomonas]|jgi:hypothetical protein|uniref:hypothetical protein n=1 Tax=Pseudomonas TaxID=286 RepID=UPI0018E7DA54|nr:MULTISPECIES: hypothetical protein [Pseudomonas]MBJ2215862.1 hypothetical protein [Pseudomonas carnis]MBP5948128.1 hypothetical protein [Pseudomonas sp. P9(2020)]